MKHKTALAAAVILTLIALCGLPARGQETIVNGKTPKGTAYTLKLTEELRVGPDHGDAFIWAGMATTVAVNGRGHMFVTDTRENRIVELDPQGAFVRQLGGKGEAPGEFQMLASFQVLDDDKGVAFENIGIVNKFTYFGPDGAYLRQKTVTGMDKILRQAALSPDGRWLGGISVKVDQANRKMVIRSGLFDPEADLVEELISYDSPLPDPSRFGDPNYWAEQLANQFRPMGQGLLGFVAFDEQGHIYTAVARRYEITKWDAERKKTATFSRAYDPPMMTEDEIQRAIEPITQAVKESLPTPQLQAMITPSLIKRAVELSEWPPHKNPVNGIRTMDDGHVLVLHDGNFATNTYRVDIFTAKGQYKGQFTHNLLGAARMTFKNGRAYTLEANQDDENVLVRYRYELVPARVDH